MALQYIFQMQGLTKAYPGGKKVFENIWLSFYPDAKIGVVGVNGSGKSTLLKIMAGIDKEFNGEAKAADGTKMGYLEQEPQLDQALNVWENVIAWCDEKKTFDAFNAVAAKLGEDYTDELMEEMTALQEKLDAGDLWDIDSKIEMAMDALRCPPNDSGVEKLSGGERRRVALARLLLSKPDMLLLDEPTNHLDAESVAWLQHHLENFPGCVILVTHDRYFLDQVTKWTLELDRGKGVPYEGNYSGWLEQKEKRVRQENSESEARQRAMARELEWVRSSAKARQAKSKARLAAYDEMVNEQEREKQSFATIQIPPGPRLGNVVIEVDGLEKDYGDKVLFNGLTFKLPPNGIVGVIGPNGAGKTTLFKMITGQEKPDAGTIRLGETVRLAYVDQTRDDLSPGDTVWQAISGGLDVIKVGNRELISRSYVGSFNFRGGDQQKKVGLLSGGERNRVHLAKTLTTGGNVILLDEPTNDLDIETLQNLEDALEQFAGCVVVISHDRWFLDRLCTHILAFEGDSHVEWFEGNFEAYEEDKKRRLGADSLIPKRIKFQKFGAMNVEIIPARPDQRPLIEGLFQFYADDFSTFEAMDSVEFELDSNGQFAAYAPMGAYWREPSRIPLLITAGGRAAGFALINAISHSGAEVDRNMAEFFVRRKYRRGGVGREAVRQILTLYPGRWEIAIAARNAPALAFWPDAVAAVSAVADLTQIDGDGEHWRGPILRFVVSPAS